MRATACHGTQAIENIWLFWSTATVAQNVKNRRGFVPRG